MKLRTILGPAIIVAWVGVLGVHVRREYFKSDSLLLTEGARMLAPGRFWYTVRLNTTTIGIGSSRLDTLAGDFLFEDDLTLDVPAMGKTHRSRAVTELRLAKDLSLKAFDFVLTSEIGNFAVKGETQADSTIKLVMDAGGKSQTTSVDGRNGLLLDAAIPLRLAAGRAFEVGKEFTVRVFDPSAMDTRDVTMKVTSRDTLVVPDSAVQNAAGKWEANRNARIPAWKLEQRFGGAVISTWVDDDGQIVRATSPLGFTIERTYHELARQDWEQGRKANGALAEGYGALIQGTAISSNVDVASLPDQDHMRVRMTNVDLTGFDLEGGRQQLRGDTLIVSRETLKPSNYRLPYNGSDPDILRELQPAPLIQINDPEIKAAAKKIVGDSRNPEQVAGMLTTWVYNTLEKSITLSVPSARQVLDAKSGDCNEHTVLYVALARAAGLPARTASGLVHLRGHFYYHAWPEVWLGEQWVAVDPTLGQFPADASHLRFILGGIANQVELIRLVGRLKLEVL